MCIRDRCNAESAAIETARGVLQLAGAQLNVTSLDLDSGEVKLTAARAAVYSSPSNRPVSFASPASRSSAVSYTHLDVYKRQA